MISQTVEYVPLCTCGVHFVLSVSHRAVLLFCFIKGHPQQLNHTFFSAPPLTSNLKRLNRPRIIKELNGCSWNSVLRDKLQWQKPSVILDNTYLSRVMSPPSRNTKNNSFGTFTYGRVKVRGLREIETSCSPVRRDFLRVAVYYIILYYIHRETAHLHVGHFIGSTKRQSSEQLVAIDGVFTWWKRSRHCPPTRSLIGYCRLCTGHARSYWVKWAVDLKFRVQPPFWYQDSGYVDMLTGVTRENASRVTQSCWLVWKWRNSGLWDLLVL